MAENAKRLWAHAAGRQSLRKESGGTVVAITALHGLRGVGKTTLAARLRRGASRPLPGDLVDQGAGGIHHARRSCGARHSTNCKSMVQLKSVLSTIAFANR
jgi:hypothetical protein